MEFGAAEVLGMRGTIAYISLFVIFLSFSFAFYKIRRREFSEGFWFSLGIGMHWVGTFQAQFGILGIIPEYFYYTGLVFVAVAGIIKVRALTIHSNPSLWRAVAFSAIVFGLLITFHARKNPQEIRWSTPRCSLNSFPTSN